MPSVLSVLQATAKDLNPTATPGNWCLVTATKAERISCSFTATSFSGVDLSMTEK